jgi:hypothetical protein
MYSAMAQNQGRVVDQGGHDLDPPVAERHPSVGRSPCDPARREGDGQRGHVRKIVNGVRDQGQAADEQPSGHLRDRQQRVGPDRDGDAPVARGRIEMGVAMVVRHGDGSSRTRAFRAACRWRSRSRRHSHRTASPAAQAGGGGTAKGAIPAMNRVMASGAKPACAATVPKRIVAPPCRALRRNATLL